jgi:3-oxoadipate enol-lactonase
MPEVKSKDGVVLHYDLHDFTDPWTDAPFLVLQHGFARSGRFWYGFIPYLARFYRVICPDLRGFGRSSTNFEAQAPIDLDILVGDLETIIDHAGARSVHYAGESFSGMLGYVFAANRPDRTRSLCTFGSPTYISEATKNAFAFGHASWADAITAMGPPAWTRAGNSGTRFPPDANPGLLEWYASQMASSNIDAMVAMANVAARMDVRPYLGKVRVPVLAVFPTSAANSANEHVQILRENVADLSVIHVPTTYHMIQAISPAACATHLLQFIARKDGRACRED